MSLRNTTFSPIKTETQTILPFHLQQISHYVLCVTLATLSGIIGVAVTIGLALIYQLFFVQAAIWTPNFVLIAAGAALTSCGVAWLVAHTGRRLIPGLDRNFCEQSWQIFFIITILTSLIEISLFMHGL